MPASRIYNPFAGSGGGGGGSGTTWLTGLVDPVGADGAVGNWWNNTVTGALFEKTGAVTWTARGNLLSTDPDSEEVKTFAFTFASGASVACFDLPANARVLSTQIIITTPFDGVGATLKVGDSLDDDRLMTADQNDPSEAAEYEANLYHRYLALTSVLLAISAAGSTQGAGIVVVEYNLNT